jgi:hypothetical protein
MMLALLIGGIGLLLAGLAAIGFGIPVQEFSFGNTLILSGSVVACTGIMILGLWTAVRELKSIAQRLGSGVAAADQPGTTALPPVSAGPGAPGNDGFLFGRDGPAVENPDKAEPTAPSPAPWQDEAAARERGHEETPSLQAPADAPPAAKPRRNLLFSSLSRKERERAQARTLDPSVLDAPPEPDAAPPVPEVREISPPATFDDAWPQSERSRPAAPPLRGSRAPSTFTEPAATTPRPDRYPPVPRNEEQPAVTVLKSGVVDGMAYSLYSDGSIEAQMPEGMMRFASIDELRSHLDQRP